jgi:hypothetical protein
VKQTKLEIEREKDLSVLHYIDKDTFFRLVTVNLKFLIIQFADDGTVLLAFPDEEAFIQKQSSRERFRHRLALLVLR